MKRGASTIQDCSAILLDVGGTLRVGDSAVEGGKEFLKILRRKKIPHYVLSNTTTLSSSALLEKLNDFGFRLEQDQLITANRAAINYLKQQNIKSVFLIGTNSQRTELEEAGIAVSDTKAGAVLVSLDYDLDYQKLSIADYLVRNGAIYLATNADTHYVTEDGLGPDAGGTIGFLRATTGKEPIITGKPYPHMIEMVRAVAGVPTHDMAIIGDQLEIDMKVAQDFGMVSVLVLTGKTKREDLVASPFQPDYVVESIANLTPLFS